MRLSTMNILEETKRGLRTWIEIDTEAIQYNVAQFRDIVGPETILSGVIKSNAYGHDIVPFAKEAVRAGIDRISVDSYVEAATLRSAGVEEPILVLGYTLPEYIEEAAHAGVQLTIATKEQLEHIQTYTAGEGLTVHIKVDTGMHRQGFQLEDAQWVIDALKRLPETIHVEGLYTHFADAKDPNDVTYTKKQVAEFEKWRQLCDAAQLQPLFHATATAGTLSYKAAHYDMVRVGIGLYGLWPSESTRAACAKSIALRPVLSWKTIISEIKTVKKGSAIGYNKTKIVARDSRIGILPIGYWHGYPRSISNRGSVIVGGKRAPVIGLVSMDMTAIDLTDSYDAAVGSEAVLIGSHGSERITVEEVAKWADTVNYEIVTRLNPRIKRIYIKPGS